MTATAEIQADELRTELELLEDAIARLRAELDQAQGDRDHHRALLEDAVELHYALEERLAVAEAELARERTASSIRTRLIADITSTRLLQRRRAIERAARVERLLAKRA
jgi:predicted  nucleic acid-binding Zn-ribbon protein